jgi:hypothetical protein
MCTYNRTLIYYYEYTVCSLCWDKKTNDILCLSISRGYYIISYIMNRMMHHSIHNIFESEKRREGELGELNVRVQECARVYERAE